MLRTTAVLLVLFCLLLSEAPVRERQTDVSIPDVVLLEPNESVVTTEKEKFRIRALVRSWVPLIGVTLILNKATVFEEPIDATWKDRQRYILDYTVTLQPGKNFVEIIARNEKTNSKPVTVTIVYERVTQPSKPTLAVLAIGVSKSKTAGFDPKIDSANAQAFAKLISTQANSGGIYGNVQTRVLLDDEVTRESILRGLKWLQSQNRSPDDIVILYLSGNLEADYQDGSLYFLTSKHDPKSDPEIADIKYSLFWDTLDYGEGNVIIFSDTCWASKGPKFLLDKFTRYGKERRINSFFASADGSQAFVDEKSPHSIFTTALLEGLAGKADIGLAGEPADQIIDTYELQTWIGWRIENLTQGKQVPVIQVPKRLQIMKLASP